MAVPNDVGMEVEVRPEASELGRLLLQQAQPHSLPRIPGENIPDVSPEVDVSQEAASQIRARPQRRRAPSVPEFLAAATGLNPDLAVFRQLKATLPEGAPLTAAVDLEHTGVPKNNGNQQLIQLALVCRFPAGLFKALWHFLPTNEPTQEAYALHGLDRAALLALGAKPLDPEQARKIAQFFTLIDRFVAHGWEADRDVLLATWRQRGINVYLPLKQPWVCTLQIAQSLPSFPNRLKQLCEVLDVPLEQEHDALHDAEAALRVHEAFTLLPAPSPEARRQQAQEQAQQAEKAALLQQKEADLNQRAQANERVERLQAAREQQLQQQAEQVSTLLKFMQTF